MAGLIASDVPPGFELGNLHRSPFTEGELTLAEARARARGGAESIIPTNLVKAYEAVWRHPEQDTIVVVTVFEFDSRAAASHFDALQTGDAVATAVELGGQFFDADDRINEARGAVLAQPQATVGLYAYVFGSRAVQVFAGTGISGQGQYVHDVVRDFGGRTYINVLGAVPSDEGLVPQGAARPTSLPARLSLRAGPTLEGLAAAFPKVLDPCSLVPRAAVEEAFGSEVRERPVGAMRGSDPTGDRCLYLRPGVVEPIAGIKILTKRHVSGPVREAFERLRSDAGGGSPLDGIGDSAYRAETDLSTHATAVKGEVTVMVLAPAGNGVDAATVESLLRAVRFPAADG